MRFGRAFHLCDFGEWFVAGAEFGPGAVDRGAADVEDVGVEAGEIADLSADVRDYIVAELRALLGNRALLQFDLPSRGGLQLSLLRP